MASENYMTIDEQEADNWDYRGEGAANVVLAYRGSDPAMIKFGDLAIKFGLAKDIYVIFNSDEALELIGKVLRLRKLVEGVERPSHEVKETPILFHEEQNLWAEWPLVAAATSSAELTHAYARDVLRPLLGEEYVDPGMLVNVSGSFVEALNRNIAHKRPSWRAESGSLVVARGVGLLISDHSSFVHSTDNSSELPPTISVEIKPKSGFLPTSPSIKEENALKKSVSRYAMHQVFKFQKGKIQGISKYCPLDLFSGAEDRIRKAVQALLETPQNNLRIFCNGEEVYGDKDGSATRTKEAELRLEQVVKSFLPDQNEKPVQAFQELVAHLLYRSDILKKLLEVQKLDSHDIEGVIEAYNKYIEECRSSTSSAESQVKDSNGSPPQQTERSEGTPNVYKFRTHSKSPFTVEDCRKALRDFLISATAKDSGIMITLQPIDPISMKDVTPGTSVVTYSDRHYLHKISLLDLDIKPLKKLPHYLKLDQDIVKAYSSCCFLDPDFFASHPSCVATLKYL